MSQFYWHVHAQGRYSLTGQGRIHQRGPVVTISSYLIGSYAQPNSFKSKPRLMTEASSYVALESASTRTVMATD